MERGKLPEIQVTFLFLAVVTVLLMTDSQGIAVHALIASVLHECGHLAAFACFGILPKEISLCSYGIRFTMSEQRALPYFGEAFTLLAGAGVNFLLAAACFFLARLTRFSSLTLAAQIELVTGSFNLLPVQLLDGGKLLSLLARRFSSRGIYKAAKLISVCCCALLLLMGCFMLLSGKVNPSFLLTGAILTAETLSQNYD